MTIDTASTPTDRRPPRRGPRAILLTAALAATFAAGGLAYPNTLLAQDSMATAVMGGHAGMLGTMREHLERMLTAVDATPDQRARINTILIGAMESLGPIHHRLAGVRGDLGALLTAPTIDRAAVEQFRAQHMADLDQASRILVSALADAAEVLTPDQRAKLGRMMAEHHAGR
ncbi:MAG: Spy/CpxP family protein refolding chaperone [Caulobacteraceae bacterium]